MPNGRDIIPKPDLPPQEMGWARDIQNGLVSAMDDIDSLKANTIADYKQANAAATASLNQVAKVRNYVRSIPYTEAKSTKVSVSLAANTWTKVIDQEILIPAGKNNFTIASSMTIGLNTGSQNPSMWFAFFGGLGSPMESPMHATVLTPQGGSTYYMKVGHAMNSIAYTLGKSGGTARIALSLWSATAITTTGEATLTYNLIAGGQL